MKEVDIVIYRRKDIAKIPEDAELVHIGYKMSLQDIGEITRTRESVKALQFPPSIVEALHPFLDRLLAMQGIKKLVGYADRYDAELVKEALKLREKGWRYERIAMHLSKKAGKDISAQVIWYWVNKRTPPRILPHVSLQRLSSMVGRSK